MKNTIKKIKCLLFLAVAILLFIPNTYAEPVIVNGSFETADYTGWTLWEDYSNPGSWGIAENGQTVNLYDEIFCEYDKNYETQYSGNLPITFEAFDGNYMAFRLTNSQGCYRMYQEVTLPASSTSISWDMFYINHSYYGPGYDFDPNEQFLSVSIYDIDDNFIETLFITEQGISPINMLPSTHSADISIYAGFTIRVVVEGCNYWGELDAGFDNFRVELSETKEPPGWSHGKKNGWNDAIPPGLEKNGKTPLGFEKGK